MKKLLAIVLVAAMVLSLTACAKQKNPAPTNDTTTTAASQTDAAKTDTAAAKTDDTAKTDAPAADTTPAVDTTPADTTPADTAAAEEGVMTHAEYEAAELDTQVTVITYVQDKQSWWDNKGTFYTQAKDGAYFLYNMACTQEEYDKLMPGTKIKVTGYKSAWSGEVEIIDATYEILTDESFVAAPVDVTALLGTEELIKHQNEFVSFTGMTVMPQADGSAFLYSWDGSGSHDSNSDLYFSVAANGQTYSFTVESYLRGNDTTVYEAVENLKVGDVIDMYGFLYWYEGANPHITLVKTSEVAAKSEGVMTYAEYAAADIDTQVTVETFVQAKQSWWNNQGTFYTQDLDGAYFLYNMPCSEEEYNKLVPGTKIKVTGYKSAWSGEVEIIDATYEIEDGSYIAPSKDITALLDKAELEQHQNQFVAFKGMTVEPQADGSAFLYNWDGSGSRDANSDLYFNVSLNGDVYTFTVESYLCGNTTEVYKAVENLKVGEIIDMEGFLYWYNGVNPHITSVKVVTSDPKSAGVMTYAQYVAAELDTLVTVETYVQAKQSWWNNQGTFYTQDHSGGYFLYNMPCSEEEYNKLVPGTKIKVTGYKSEWSGEVEIIDSSFEIEEGSYIAEPIDVTALLLSDDLIKYQNRYVSFTGMIAVPMDGKVTLYSWDNSGSHDANSDLYFHVMIDYNFFDFTVESYLCDNTTEVYQTVENLKSFDILDMTGFLYWYNGVNPHITGVVVRQ